MVESAAPFAARMKRNRDKARVGRKNYAKPREILFDEARHLRRKHPDSVIFKAVNYFLGDRRLVLVRRKETPYCGVAFAGAARSSGGCVRANRRNFFADKALRRNGDKKRCACRTENGAFAAASGAANRKQEFNESLSDFFWDGKHGRVFAAD